MNSREMKMKYETPAVEMQQVALEQVIASSPTKPGTNTGNEGFEDGGEGVWGD